MSTCIRCGAEVTLQGRSYLAADGGGFCPSSLAGEAAVHRTGERLPQRPATPALGGRTLLGKAFTIFAAYEAGRGVSRLISGPRVNVDQEQQNFFTAMQKVAGTYDPNA